MLKKLADQEQRQAAKEFYERYKDRGGEKQDDQSFWNDLLHDVLGVERPSDFIDYQKKIHFEDSVKYADGYIKTTKILIEQKGKNPRKITPREASRLQGFPEEFIIPVSDTQAYKQFGNSVAVPVIHSIAENIVAVLDNTK